LQSLDREVDLAVFLDGDELGLDLVAHLEMVLHVSHGIPVDLGDVNQADLAILQLEECPIGRDPLHDPLHDRSDL
jgi:hypothetical protein